MNISMWKLIHKQIRIDGLTKHRLTNILSKKMNFERINIQKEMEKNKQLSIHN